MFHPPSDRIYTDGWDAYALLDAGGGKKLERFGDIILIRPEVQAYFQSGWPFSKWNELAHAEFVDNGKQQGRWKILREDLPQNWQITWENLCCKLELTAFKHTGIFPEQASNWNWLKERCESGKTVLNLFAYTGMASLVARSCGADVYHVDAVKQLISWSRENMELSGLDHIRWVLDDAPGFARKELKRGRKYDGIIMDPPAFGRGAKGERWILEKQLPELFQTAAQLLKPDGFLLVNTYSPKLNITDLKALALSHFPKRELQVAALWMNSQTGKELYFGDVLRIS